MQMLASLFKLEPLLKALMKNSSLLLWIIYKILKTGGAAVSFRNYRILGNLACVTWNVDLVGYIIWNVF